MYTVQCTHHTAYHCTQHNRNLLFSLFSCHILQLHYVQCIIFIFLQFELELGKEWIISFRKENACIHRNRFIICRDARCLCSIAFSVRKMDTRSLKTWKNIKSEELIFFMNKRKTMEWSFRCRKRRIDVRVWDEKTKEYEKCTWFSCSFFHLFVFILLELLFVSFSTFFLKRNGFFF